MGIHRVRTLGWDGGLCNLNRGMRLSGVFAMMTVQHCIRDTGRVGCSGIVIVFQRNIPMSIIRLVLLVPLLLTGCETSSLETDARLENESVGAETTRPSVLDAAAVYDTLVTQVNHAQSIRHGGEAVAEDDALRSRVLHLLTQMNQPMVRQMIGAQESAYSLTLGQLRTHELPEVLAAIPLRSDLYMGKMHPETCAAGHWQLEPNIAVSMGLKVSECTLKSGKTVTVDGKAESNANPPAYISSSGDNDRVCLYLGRILQSFTAYDLHYVCTAEWTRDSFCARARVDLVMLHGDMDFPHESNELPGLWTSTSGSTVATES